MPDFKLIPSGPDEARIDHFRACPGSGRAHIHVHTVKHYVDSPLGTTYRVYPSSRKAATASERMADNGEAEVGLADSLVICLN